MEEEMVLYSSTTCTKCLLLKSNLKKNGVAFTEELDEVVVLAVASDLGVMELPILKVGEDFYVGMEALTFGQGLVNG